MCQSRRHDSDLKCLWKGFPRNSDSAPVLLLLAILFMLKCLNSVLSRCPVFMLACEFGRKLVLSEPSWPAGFTGSSILGVSRIGKFFKLSAEYLPNGHLPPSLVLLLVAVVENLQ